MGQRNSYYNNFQKPEAAAAVNAQIMSAETNPRGFDRVFEMDDETEDRADYTVQNKYGNKKKPKDVNKEVQSAVLTSSQTIGWRQPYDNVVGGNNRSGMCKRTFHDSGHL